MIAFDGGLLNLEAGDCCEHSLSGFLAKTTKIYHNFIIDERMKYWLHYGRVLPSIYSDSKGSYIHIRDKTSNASTRGKCQCSSKTGTPTIPSPIGSHLMQCAQWKVM